MAPMSCKMDSRRIRNWCRLWKDVHKCANGQGCVADTDCLSTKCNVGLASAALTVSELCSDGVKLANQRNWRDCGGACTPCADENIAFKIVTVSQAVATWTMSPRNHMRLLL